VLIEAVGRRFHREQVCSISFVRDILVRVTSLAAGGVVLSINSLIGQFNRKPEGVHGRDPPLCGRLDFGSCN
jgi:hypothetical protein